MESIWFDCDMLPCINTHCALPLVYFEILFIHRATLAAVGRAYS